MNGYVTEEYEEELYEYGTLPEVTGPNAFRILGMEPRFILFILFMAIASLLPGTKNPYYWFAGFQIRLTELVLIAMGFVFMLVKLLFGRSLPCSKSTKRFFLYPFLLLGLFQIFSLVWSDVADIRRLASMRVVYMCSALIASVLAISGLPQERRRIFMHLYSFFLACVILIYIGLSFWFPSFRPSYAYIEGFEAALGWIRVHGPLFGAATMGVVVLPVMAYCLGIFLTRGAGKILWAVLAIFFIVAIVLSGSRAALLGVAFLLLLLALMFPIKATKFLVPTLILVGVALLVWDVPERLRVLKDTARFESYKTGMRAFASGPPSILVGHGHGSFYNSINPAKTVTPWRKVVGTQMTRYGFSLVNSHSTYIQTLVETGLVGFVLVITPLMWLTWRCFAKRYRRIKTPMMLQARIRLLGAMATFPLMAMDAYIIRNYWLTTVWAVYAVSAAEEVEEAEYLESCAYQDYSIAEEADSYGS